MTRELSEIDVKEIREFAIEKRGRCRRNDVIGLQVFSLLGYYARVIYYPLGKDAPWGFTRISGSRDDAQLEKPFVAINTSISVECQVFAAAHELYHIWYKRQPDYLPTDLLNEEHREFEEKRANRFAAEFLVDEQLLKQLLDYYEIYSFSVKVILQLASLFTVPYRTMVKRLQEVSALTGMEARHFLKFKEEDIAKYRRMYAVPEMPAPERVAMDNLAELAVKAYEKRLISFEKLEYLLDMCELKPEELGVEKPEAVAFPGDDELDRIMEERGC